MITDPNRTFGVREPGVDYIDRSAAYAVVFGEGDTVAAVTGSTGQLWLPGGGRDAGESAEETLARELREELARGVQSAQRLGEAIQFYYAPVEGRHYHMHATFFLAELGASFAGQPEHTLHWVPRDQVAATFFHACHIWAVDLAAGGS